MTDSKALIRCLDFKSWLAFQSGFLTVANSKRSRLRVALEQVAARREPALETFASLTSTSLQTTGMAPWCEETLLPQFAINLQ